MSSLEHNFKSLPQLSHTHVDKQVQSSLLDLSHLLKLTPLTVDIDSIPKPVPDQPAYLSITDDDIFLDATPHHSISNLSFGGVEGVERPGFDPKHSMYAKVQSNVSRWNKPLVDEDGMNVNAVVKREIRQVQKAIARIVEKKVYAPIRKSADKIKSSDKLVDSHTLINRLQKTAPIPRIQPKHQQPSSAPLQRPPTHSNKAFLMKPSIILFKDCIPGKSYKQTLQVQNSTAHIQSYFVEPFHASVSSFLTVQPTASLSISPGLKWDIEIEFFTAWDMKDDIETGLKLCSSTGVTHILPVFAKLKQEASFVEYGGRKFSFDHGQTLCINFGVCQIKKTRKVAFSVTNDGLFDGVFQWEGEIPQEFKLDKQHVKLKAGEISVFSLTYCPRDPEASKGCKFKLLHMESGNCVVVECVATLPPKALRVSKAAVDFGNCMPNKVYHAEFELFNLQQAALMYDAEICFDMLEKTNTNPLAPIDLDDATTKTTKRQLKNSVYVKALQGEFEIFPKRGLIQRNSTSKIKIKFIKHQTRSLDNFLFVLPVRFTNESTGEQWVSTLKGVVSSTEFVLRRAEVIVPRNITAHVHLQPHPVFENKIEKFSIYNPSSAAQEFKITIDASNVRTSDSLIKLDRYETKTFKITLTGLKPEENKFCIAIKSTFLNVAFPFAVRGVSPAVYFTNSFLRFEPITLSGSKEITTKICFNTHTDPEEDFEYEFTFDRPTIISSKIEEVSEKENKWSYLDTQKCPLRVYPNQAMLQTSDMITLKILANPAVIQNAMKEFKLSTSQMDINDTAAVEAKKTKIKETKPPTKADAKGSKKEVPEVVIVPETKIDRNMQLLHAKLDGFKNTELDCIVKCHIKRYPSEKLLLKRLLNVITTDDEKMHEVENTIELHVVLPIIRPDYYFLEDKDSTKRTPFRVDFGRAIIGERVTKTVPFKMISMCMVNASVVGGIDASLFTFPTLSALDLTSECLTVECCPTSTETREVIYEFKSEFTSTWVVFCVEAFSPRINLSASTLTFPDTLVGESSSQTISLANPGEYPISVSIKIQNSEAYSVNVSAESIIQPLTSLDVTVAFKPQVFTLSPEAGLSVTYVGQSDVHFVTFQGRGCETTLSVTGFDTGKQASLLKSSSIEFNIVDSYFSSDISPSRSLLINPASKDTKPGAHQDSTTAINSAQADRTKSFRYALYTCPGADFCISNLKPIVKIEVLQKKQTSNLTYAIELFDGMYYIDGAGHCVITEKVNRVFHSIDLTGGVLEIGQNKKFSVKKVDGMVTEDGEERASFYKITLAGGFKVLEPKGCVAPEEPTVYILKVVDA